jgi:hypothetical protein
MGSASCLLWPRVLPHPARTAEGAGCSKSKPRSGGRSTLLGSSSITLHASLAALPGWGLSPSYVSINTQKKSRRVDPSLRQPSFKMTTKAPLLPQSKERVRERSGGRFTRPARSGCGTAKFRLTSPAARDARGDLSLVKERLRYARCAGLCEALLVQERSEDAKRMVVQSLSLVMQIRWVSHLFKSRFQIWGRPARQGWAFS